MLQVQQNIRGLHILFFCQSSIMALLFLFFISDDLQPKCVSLNLGLKTNSLSPSLPLSSRPKGRFLLWPTTAAACSVGNSSCWEECFPVQTPSLTAAATRCTSSTRTSRSGTSLSSRAVDPLPAQGRMVWFTKWHAHFLCCCCVHTPPSVPLDILRAWCSRGRSLCLAAGTLPSATMTCTCWTLVRDTLFH